MNDTEHISVQQRLLKKIKDEDAKGLFESGDGAPKPGPLANADGHGAASTDCGDTLELFVTMKGDVIHKSSFTSRGCVFTLACGRAIASLVRGKTLGDARRATTPQAIDSYLGGLPEHNFHCAQLAANAAHAAIKDTALTQRDPWKKHYRKS